MKQKHFSLQQIVVILKRLQQRKETGTFFIVTEHNRSARLILDNGEIVSIYCFNKFGEEAIGLMSDIESGMCRFQKGEIPSRRDNLPSTEEILDAITDISQGIVVQKKIDKNTTKAHSQITSAQKLALEDCLEEYIGAMAPLICEEHLEANPDLPSVLNTLSSVVEQISGSTDAKNFKQSVIEQLN